MCHIANEMYGLLIYIFMYDIFPDILQYFVLSRLLPVPRDSDEAVSGLC